VLIEESEGSDLLVVGAVSQHVAAYAKCPVVVVR
jgi:nucleotide-binding universal stress UspA family protein